MQGNLIVRPLSANLYHDKDLFGKMDPYVRVKVGAQLGQTSVAHNAGKHPSWADKMSFKKTVEDVITFEIWDRDTNSKDDFVGSGAMSLSLLYQKGNKMFETVQLDYKGKGAGQLQVEVEFYPSMGGYGGVMPMQTQMGMMPQQGYPQQQMMPQQVYPQQQMMPQQVYPQQQMMPQQMVQPQYQQTIPQQVIPQQMVQPQYQQSIPQQVMPQQQMMPQQGYPQQMPMQQAMPQQVYPQQMQMQQGMPQQMGIQQVIPQQGYIKPTGYVQYQ